MAAENSDIPLLQKREFHQFEGSVLTIVAIVVMRGTSCSCLLMCDRDFE